MKIVIIGTGYVGLVSGACFSEMGNDVLCVDIDKEKIKGLKNGIIPIYEPGLKNLVINNINSKRLSFSTSLKKTINRYNIIFIAVGTPEKENGEVNMDYVYSVAKDIGKNLNQESIIITKSTVPVGTSNKIFSIIKAELKRRKKNIIFHVASNPEFLKEGDAINDFMKPDRVIIGTNNNYVFETIKQLYSHFIRTNTDRIVKMGIEEAELTKYVANAMLAAKISFINEISHICDNLNIDIESIRKGIGSDSRIGYSFIYPGVGYGGSCFPKDIKALIHLSNSLNIKPLILESIDKRNNIQKNRIYKYLIDAFGGDIYGKKIAVWGLSFKPGTDDMREAPSIVTINSLINDGANIIAFDPVAHKEAIKQFPDKWFENKKIILAKDNYAALEGVDALIILTEWKMFRNPNLSKMKDLMKNYYIFDGRNLYDPAYMKKNGFHYKGIGR